MDMKFFFGGVHYLTHHNCHAPFQGESSGFENSGFVKVGEWILPTPSFVAIVGAEATCTQVHKGRPERPSQVI